MDAISLVRGLLAGLVATGVMTVVEVIARSWWGPDIVLDWQQNQFVAARVLKRPPAAVVGAGLVLHAVHGMVAGIVFVVALPVLAPLAPWWTLGIGVGLVLWVLTLLVHSSVTGRRPSSGGRIPIALAFATHVLYGVALAVLVVWP